jgi:hypothetical protein
VDERKQIIEITNQKQAGVLILDDFESEKEGYREGQHYRNKYFSKVQHLLDFVQRDQVLAREKTEQVEMDHLGNWSVILSDGTKIKVGKTFEFSSRKRAVLQTILRSSDRNDLLYIDTRYDDILVKKKPLLA